MLIRNLYVCILLMLIFGATSYSQDIPPRIPNTYVQDHAQVLSPTDEAEIQQNLRVLKDKYNLECGIAIIDSTGIYPIESYGLKMARTYGIGSKDGEKRGLLLLIAVKDRKWNWQISRHMESVLTDGESGEIGRKILTPNLKAAMQTDQSRDWKVALITTVKAIDVHIKNRIEPEKKQPVISPSDNSDDSGMWYGGCCVGVLLLMGIAWGLNAYSSGAGEREMKKRKKREAESRMRWLASPAGIAWTETQNKLAAQKAAEEAEQLRIQEERDREARRIRDEEKRKHEEWLQSTPEGRKEAKRLARIREAMEESTISPVVPSTYDDTPSFGSSSSYSSSDDSNSSSSDSFSGGSDFGGGGSSGDF